ncbi:MAG: cell envelope integrity protein TolA [Motiliproteus sp.]
MKDIHPYRSYIIPAVLAVGLHVGIVFLASTTWFEAQHSPRVVPFQHIKAELIDLKSQKVAGNQKKSELKKQQAAKREADAKRKARKKEKQKKIAADKKRKAKEKKAADTKKRQQITKAKAEKKRKVDAKRNADLKRKQDEIKRQAKAKKLDAEKKRKADADKRKQQALSKQKAEQKKRREADQLKRQQEQELLAREQALADEVAREEQSRRMLSQDQTAKASAISVITAAVSANWRRPPTARNGMVVQVRIHLLPTGEVSDAYALKTSGDEAFDRSAVNAVLKAERFPELQDIDPEVFDRNLRTITLKFKPEDLRL